jgi:RTX calcium-binding nonapeptide repeat (4 copies)
VLSLAGAGERVLGPPGAYSAVEWSPDGTRLLLADDAGQTWVVDLRDGSRRFLFAGKATWSPDGTQVAILNGPVVILARADGTEGRVVRVVLDTLGTAPRWLTQAQDRATGSGTCDSWVEESGPADGTDGPDTFFVGFVSVQLRALAGDDRVFTTGAPSDYQTDSIDMGAGNDIVSVLQSRGVVRLGPGDDSFEIGGVDIPEQGSHVVYGGGGNDYLRGGPDDDRLYGGPGDDRVRGFVGANRLYGGAGDDSVTGRLAAQPQLLDGGPGRDTIAGGAGPDRILARDGYADTIDCGAGRDIVIAERRDLWASNCEQVVIR